MMTDPVLNQPVRGLQLMLRTIAYGLRTIPVVNPDGIYGPSTEEAVRKFQQEYGLPVTGITDEATFLKITEIYELAQELLAAAEAPVIHFPSTLIISPGQFHPHIYLIQAMFTAIHGTFPDYFDLKLTGTLDPDTEHDICLLQRQAGLPETGTLDKVTWNRLCLIYRVLFDRTLLPSQG